MKTSNIRVPDSLCNYVLGGSCLKQFQQHIDRFSAVYIVELRGQKSPVRLHVGFEAICWCLPACLNDEKIWHSYLVHRDVISTVLGILHSCGERFSIFKASSVLGSGCGGIINPKP